MSKYRYIVSLQTDRDEPPNDYEYISDYLLYEGEPNGKYDDNKDNLDDMFYHFAGLFNHVDFVIIDYTLLKP